MSFDVDGKGQVVMPAEQRKTARGEPVGWALTFTLKVDEPDPDTAVRKLLRAVTMITARMMDEADAIDVRPIYRSER